MLKSIWGTPTTVTVKDIAATGALVLNAKSATGTATAAKTFSIAVNVPTNCLIVACQLRNDVVLTSSDGGTAYSAAFATGSTIAISAATAFAANTKVNKIFDVNAAAMITSNTTTITVTADSSKTFAANGKVTAVVYYYSLTAMTDV